MNKIIEKILEPSRIEVGSTFKLKIKIEDILNNKKILVTEDGVNLMTENREQIRTEWGELYE